MKAGNQAAALFSQKILTKTPEQFFVCPGVFYFKKG